MPLFTSKTPTWVDARECQVKECNPGERARIKFASIFQNNSHAEKN
jgi:hypothetical protein